MSVYDILNEVLSFLGGISAKTIKLGLEPNLSPSEYPIVRIVAGDSELSSDDGWAENVYFSVYVGAKLDDKIGLDKIYKELYTLENAVKFTLHNTQILEGGLVRFIKTISDDDTLKNFKILSLKFVVKGVRTMV